MVLPSWRQRTTGSGIGWRLCSLTIRKISLNGRPRASAVRHPVSNSATGFRYSTTAEASVVSTASPIECNVTCARSLASNSSASACARSAICCRSSALARNNSALRIPTCRSSSAVACSSACCARRYGLVSRIVTRTWRPCGVDRGLRLISAANSLPSRRRPDNSRPAPIGRGPGSRRYAAICR